MKRKINAFTISMLFLASCTQPGINASYNISVIDTLEKDFIQFLDSGNYKYKVENNYYKIKINTSRSAEAYTMLGEFYRYRNQSITGKEFYDDGQVIYCCNIGDSLVDYLLLYHGKNIIHEIADKVRQTILKYPDFFVCSKCSIAVRTIGSHIEISYTSDEEILSNTKIVDALGLSPHTPQLNMADLVTSIYNGDSLIKEYLLDYTKVNFEKS